MSRSARNRIDKRDFALALASTLGHGTPLPGDEQPHDEQQEPADPWGYGEPSGPRIPIGPIDVKGPRSDRLEAP